MGSGLQQVLAKRDGDGFGAIRGTDFCQEAIDMCIDAVKANAKLHRNIFVRKTLRHGLQKGQ